MSILIPHKTVVVIQNNSCKIIGDTQKRNTRKWHPKIMWNQHWNIWLALWWNDDVLNKRSFREREYPPAGINKYNIVCIYIFIYCILYVHVHTYIHIYRYIYMHKHVDAFDGKLNHKRGSDSFSSNRDGTGWKTGSLVDHFHPWWGSAAGTASWIWTLGAERVWCCAAYPLVI